MKPLYSDMVPFAPSKHSRYTVMPIDRNTQLPLSTWDRETLRAVALAYRRVRRLGERDLQARNAAEALYLSGTRAYPRWMLNTRSR